MALAPTCVMPGWELIALGIALAGLLCLAALWCFVAEVRFWLAMVRFVFALIGAPQEEDEGGAG